MGTCNRKRLPSSTAPAKADSISCIDIHCPSACDVMMFASLMKVTLPSSFVHIFIVICFSQVQPTLLHGAGNVAHLPCDSLAPDVRAQVHKYH